MQRISRAPVLSATRRRVSCWIIGHRSRTSSRRQRLVRLSGRLSITRTVSPLLASLRSSCACSVDDGADDLLVDAVPARDVDAHGDRLVGLVGDHDALADLRAAGPVLGGLGRAGRAGLDAGGLAARLRFALRQRRRAAAFLRARRRARRRAPPGCAWGRASPVCAERSRLRRSLGRAAPPARRPRRRLGLGGGLRRRPSGASSTGASSTPVLGSLLGSRRLHGRSSGVLGASSCCLSLFSSSVITSASLSSAFDVDPALAGDRQAAREVAASPAPAGRCSRAGPWRAGSGG